MTTLNGNPGRSGHNRALAGARLILAAREQLANLINAGPPECIAFCFNCTDALNTAIKGTLCVGDHVITSLLEHNSVLRVLSTLQKRGLIDLTLVEPEPDGAVSPARFRKALRSNTRLCILTHASNVTGAIQPVAEVGRLMRAAGVRYLIDGAQAIGHLPVDVQALRCDLYAFPGHKSLLGPQGTGGLYIRPGAELYTLREGGTGSSSDSMLQPKEMPERYESGTVNLPGIAGLGAGCNYVSGRIARIMSHERELTQALYEGLKAIRGTELYSPPDESARAGIVSFNIGDLSSSQAADALSQADIAVRGGLHCAPGAHRFLGTLRRGAVRVSVGHANTFDEVEQFLRTVREISVDSQANY